MPIWNVPFPRNPFFTGREQLLQNLHDALTHKWTAMRTPAQIQVISGLGGIGKTQTAVEYCYRYQHKYQAVLWTRAESETTLQTGFTQLATLLSLSEAEAQNPHETVQAIKRWLEQTPDWLLVLDNADEPDILRPFLPSTARGHVLITSRATVFDSFGLVTPLALGVLSPEEALTFLLTRTGRPHPDQAEHHAAELLAEALGYLPLALEQSSAYILAKHAPFQTYLTSYRSQRLALLNKSRPKLGEYPAAVATTWTLNIREVEHTPGALDLLRLSSFLSPDQIPLELIGQGATHLGNSLSEVLASVEEDPLVLHELLEPLARYSLIQADVDTQTYSIHRLVQEVVKDNMDAATQRFWAERTVRVVNTSFPFDEAGPWALSQRYLPHALLCQALIVQEQMLFPEAANLLYKVGIYFYWRAQYPEVEPLFPQALGIQEHLFGPEHPNTANSLDSLASLYHKQGQDEQAEPLYQQALAIYERVLGTEHPSAVRTLENYIVLLEKTKRQAEAAKLKERVKAIRAKKQR